jgi:hypothetical protein
MLPPKIPAARVSATPAIVNHLVKACLLAGAGALCVYFFAIILNTVLRNPSDDWLGFFCFGLGLLLFGVLLILSGSRRVYSVVDKPSLLLGGDGIEARVPSPRLFPRLFLARHRMQRHTIPWADFLSTQTYSYSVNFFPVTQELWIKSRQGILKLDSNLFEGSSKQLQVWLLDFYEDLRRSGPIA